MSAHPHAGTKRQPWVSRNPCVRISISISLVTDLFFNGLTGERGLSMPRMPVCTISQSNLLPPASRLHTLKKARQHVLSTCPSLRSDCFFTGLWSGWCSIRYSCAAVNLLTHARQHPSLMCPCAFSALFPGRVMVWLEWQVLEKRRRLKTPQRSA